MWNGSNKKDDRLLFSDFERGVSPYSGPQPRGRGGYDPRFAYNSHYASRRYCDSYYDQGATRGGGPYYSSVPQGYNPPIADEDQRQAQDRAWKTQFELVI